MATAEVAPCEDCRFSMLFNYRICLSYGHYMVVIPSRIICGLSSNWKQGACVLNSIFYQKFWGILLMSNVQFLLSSTWLAFKILFSFFITAVGIFVYFPCTWVAPLCTLFIYKERKKKKDTFQVFQQMTFQIMWMYWIVCSIPHGLAFIDLKCMLLFSWGS